MKNNQKALSEASWRRLMLASQQSIISAISVAVNGG